MTRARHSRHFLHIWHPSTHVSSCARPPGKSCEIHGHLNPLLETLCTPLVLGTRSTSWFAPPHPLFWIWFRPPLDLIQSLLDMRLYTRPLYVMAIRTGRGAQTYDSTTKLHPRRDVIARYMAEGSRSWRADPRDARPCMCCAGTGSSHAGD